MVVAHSLIEIRTELLTSKAAVLSSGSLISTLDIYIVVNAGAGVRTHYWGYS